MLLRAVVEITGLRFACVARVTRDSWTTCAVLDQIGFGLKPGDELDVATTLCSEVRDSNAPIVIDKASEDNVYCKHPTPLMYGFESYISIPLYRANGEYFGTLCALDPLSANVSNQKIISAMNTFSEVISMQLEAEQRYDASEAALADERVTAELREQFIAVLGHDLRTPLGAIMTGTELLLQRGLEQQANTVVESIRRSGDRIARLVDDVMDFARGRLGGGITLDMEDAHDLAGNLRDVVVELQRIYPQRSIEFEPEDVGTLRCSPDRISQLFANLLNNALTYGAPDRPVKGVLRRQEGTLVIAVTNHGTPIPPEVLPHLFQPYWRGSKKNPHAGLGLGLYIASEIARSHRGELHVHSNAEATTFTFRMPLIDAD